jgi:hypothetical protein
MDCCMSSQGLLLFTLLPFCNKMADCNCAWTKGFNKGFPKICHMTMLHLTKFWPAAILKQHGGKMNFLYKNDVVLNESFPTICHMTMFHLTKFWPAAILTQHGGWVNFLHRRLGLEESFPTICHMTVFQFTIGLTGSHLEPRWRIKILYMQ